MALYTPYTSSQGNDFPAAPAVTDDGRYGFAVGFLWCNTLTRVVYRCLDNTYGAAVWVAINDQDAATVAPAVSAAGTDLATATAIAERNTVITTAAASTGVKLPVTTSVDVGKRMWVKNSGASTVNVYPGLAGTINGGAAGAAVTIATTAFKEFVCTAANAWHQCV